jgi:anti-sigma28 factor (negative regulator of flagellin synthesis)
MKIEDSSKGKIGSEIEALSRAEAGKASAQKQKATQDDVSKTETKAASESKIDISLSRYINQALNSEEIIAQRKARVEELKRLIADNNYNPSSEDVASAIGNEIALEILSNRTER